MARKPKRKGQGPAPAADPAPLANPPPDDTPLSFAEFCAKNPDGFHVTSIPEMREAGLPFVGIVAEPGRLKHDLSLFEMGKAVGRHERNRKSSSETIRRNVGICDLRKQNRQLWSLARLAKKFDVTKRAISKVLKEEDKWRKWLSQLDEGDQKGVD